MRVFWFNNLLFPEAAQSLGLPPPDSGGWMPSLGHALNETGKIKLAVATVVKNPAWSKKDIDGISHYAIPYPKGGSKEIILSPGKKLLGDCLKAVEDFAPDVVQFTKDNNIIERSWNKLCQRMGYEVMKLVDQKCIL